MPENILYEYAVIRLVPRVERQEFINVGLILFSKPDKRIHTDFHLCEDKFALFAPELEYSEIQRNLLAFKQIADGQKDAGPIAALDVPERFRWLTAMRSSIIQTSRPHPGISKDLRQTFDRLFEELVK